MKNNPVIFLFRKMWEYSKGNRKKVVLYFVLFFFGNTMWLVQPIIVAVILNSIQKVGINAGSFPNLIFYLSLFIVANGLAWAFHGPGRVVETKNAFLVRAQYKEFLLKGTMDLPVSWHSDHHSGDTIDKIEKGTMALFEFSRSSFEIFKSLVDFAIAYIVLVYFNVHASYIVFFMVFITISMILKFDKVLMKQLGQIHKIENTISAKVYDVISNITTVIILRIEKLVSKEIVKKIMKPFALYCKYRKVNEIKWFLVSMMGSVMLFLVMLSYIFVNVKSGTIVLIGTIYILYDYVNKIVHIFYNFAWMYGGAVEQKTAVANAELLSNNFEEKELSEQKLNEKWKGINVENLSFSYHAEVGKDLHLNRISFSIGKGEKIAFIGDSGSGKTTTLKIIRDLYKPQRGKITVDGRILPDGFGSISSNISLIPQDPEIFATNIKENITVGVSHNMDFIKKFTNMARFTEVAERLPRKFNSSIVERGVNLSGGEKQRLALARGLMASVDKEIVLLDEPTSSVDSKNERIIYENIFKAFHNKAIISSVHRLHLLSMFDTVYFFKNAKIIASGSFKKILRESQDFQILWEKYNKSHKD